MGSTRKIIAVLVVILAIICIYLSSDISSEKMGNSLNGIEEYYPENTVLMRCKASSFRYYSNFSTYINITEEGIFMNTPDKHYVSLILNKKNYMNFTSILLKYKKHIMSVNLSGWYLSDSQCSGTRTELFFTESMKVIGLYD